MMPLIGTLSDTYGRKVLLTIPLTLSIFPLGNYFFFSSSIIIIIIIYKKY